MSGWWKSDDRIKDAYRKNKIPRRKCFGCDDMLAPAEVKLYKMFPWNKMPTYDLNGKDIHYMNLFVLCRYCPKFPIISPEQAVYHQTQTMGNSEIIEKEKMNKDLIKKHDDLIESNKVLAMQINGLNTNHELLEKEFEKRSQFIKKKKEHINNLIHMMDPLLDVLSGVKEQVVSTIEDIGEVNIMGTSCGVCHVPISKTIAIIPCGHIFCEGCMSKLNSCPSCRGPSNKTMEVFLI